MNPTDANLIFEKFGWKPYITEPTHGVTQWRFVTPGVSYTATVAPRVILFTLGEVAEGHNYQVPEIRASKQYPHQMNLSNLPDGVLILALGRIADNANTYEANSAPVPFVQYAINEISEANARGNKQVSAFIDLLVRVADNGGWTQALYQSTKIMYEADRFGPDTFGADFLWLDDMIRDAGRKFGVS